MPLKVHERPTESKAIRDGPRAPTATVTSETSAAPAVVVEQLSATATHGRSTRDRLWRPMVLDPVEHIESDPTGMERSSRLPGDG